MFSRGSHYTDYSPIVFKSFLIPSHFDKAEDLGFVEVGFDDERGESGHEVEGDVGVLDDYRYKLEGLGCELGVFDDEWRVSGYGSLSLSFELEHSDSGTGRYCLML